MWFIGLLGACVYVWCTGLLGLTLQQKPGSYLGGGMMIMKYQF